MFAISLAVGSAEKCCISDSSNMGGVIVNRNASILPKGSALCLSCLISG